MDNVEQEKTTSGEVVGKKQDNQIIAQPDTFSQAESLIKVALEKKLPVETMERLLAMRKDLKAEWAKEQYDLAMAKFQGECPVIKKSKEGGKTKSGEVAYYYAPLDVIVQQTKDLISGNGFSYSVKSVTENNKVSVTCFVKHIAGHGESSTVDVPLGAQTGVMSAPQVVASALTFAKRYAFCNAFGILTGDEDDDNNISRPTQTQKPPMQTPQKDWKDQAKTPEQSMFPRCKTLIENSKSLSDLETAVKEIEKLKVEGKLSNSDISALRGLFQEKQKVLK